MRFMDSIFRGITSFIGKAIDIRFITKYTGTAKDNKNFSIRILNHGGIESNNGFFIQKYNDTTFLDTFLKIDWDTKNITINGILTLPCIQLSSTTIPAPIKGGIYFNQAEKNWYKCDDGINWVITNI